MFFKLGSEITADLDPSKGLTMLGLMDPMDSFSQLLYAYFGVGGCKNKNTGLEFFLKRPYL